MQFVFHLLLLSRPAYCKDGSCSLVKIQEEVLIMKDLKELIVPIQRATGIKDPVAWMVSQIRHHPRLYDQRIWSHIRKCAYRDFIQEIYLQMLIWRPTTRRQLLQCLYRAFYSTARQLGWRKSRSGRWQYDFVYN